MSRPEQLTAYFHFTREVLPARARREGWVVTSDHCFQRIILDNTLGDAWRNKLTDKSPAYRQLSDDQLERAVELAAEIERKGDVLLRELNQNSLRWRGKVRG